MFLDSDASWNLSPELLAEELDERRRLGRPMPAAAVVVDLYGRCADYARIEPLLAEHGVPLIEDAAESVGATVEGRAAGSFGDVGVLSFNGNKIITTSGGGALVVDDEAKAARYRHLATQAREPAPHYEHVEVGFNHRLSNLLAALGRPQLATLDARIERRRAIATAYREALADRPGVGFQPELAGHRPNHWLTCITIDPSTGTTRDTVMAALAADDIESRPTWKPMHLQPVFDGAPARVDGTSDALFATGLCLPSGSGLTEAEQVRVIERLAAALPT